MAYQIRFFKSNPIRAWLHQIASLVEICLYQKPAFSPGVLTSEQRRRLIRKALVEGLSTFLIKRGLCDTHPNCDLGLQPAPENKSDDRFELGVINAPVNRYLFRGNIALDGAVGKMTDALKTYIPEVSFEERKIKIILKDSLGCHLFENPRCFHHTHCRHSLLRKMDRDFAFPLRGFKKPELYS